MPAGKGGNANFVRSLIEEKVNSMGFSVWDVLFEKEGGDMLLSISVEKTGASVLDNSVELNDVEAIHRAISPIIDEADPIDEAYILEVCSPGVERLIRTKDHWARCEGEKVSLKFFSSQDGRKELTAVLISSDDEKVTLKDGDAEFSYPKKAISRATLYYDYSADSDDGPDGE